MAKITADKNGHLSLIEFGKETVGFRRDNYGGPSLWAEDGGTDREFALEEKDENTFCGSMGAVEAEIKYAVSENVRINILLKNTGAEIFKPERLFLRLGIDTYMDTYPEWNKKLFPTLLRCEKTHFYGYFMSPDGQILAVASKKPIKSWKLDYNIINEDHNGHRIYTAELDLLSTLPQPARHPQGFERLEPGEEKAWEIILVPCDDVYKIKEKIHKTTGIEFIEAENYTLFGNEKPHLKLMCGREYKICVYDPNNKKIYETDNTDITCAFEKEGVYRIELIADYISTIYVYKRKKWSYYLDTARKQALLKPQKATTHLEAWYGFFSAFLAAKYMPDSEYDIPLLDMFDKILAKMYDIKEVRPLTAPGRINNTGAAISMLCDAYEATGKKKYIEFASKLGDWMMKSQHTDGSYRAYYKELSGHDKNSIGVHYTAVVYPAKSILELALIEKNLGKTSEEWRKRYERHFDSVKRAMDDLAKNRDDIDTEGEITFEDGMISCAALQLGMTALVVDDAAKREKYTEAAEYLINKHRCLEQMIVPDCRVKDCSLRFWEAQYDVMYGENMINSPHGWTSWKTYATYYLYLLTGKEEYLVRTFDGLSACMQVIDVESNDLRWAFICDPCVKTDIWVENMTKPHNGVKRSAVIGEQYVDMISGWYTVKDDNPVGAYLSMNLETDKGTFKVDNRGGCCDNDVHEHFKCLEEVALTSAYVIIKNDKITAVNCTCVVENGVWTVRPYENMVSKVHVNSAKEIPVKVVFCDGTEEDTSVCGMKWINKYSAVQNLE
ncbi:MAG: hypothetical protein PUB42_04575 [Firmicutes bacterium]|nr:hypothetical protein [Bacillota bacterium]